MRYVDSGKLGKETKVQYAGSCMIPYSSVCIAATLPTLPSRACLLTVLPANEYGLG